MTVRRAGPVLLLVLAAAPLYARAQAPFRPELRADAIAGRVPALHLGVGASRPAGTYARLVGVAAQGIAWKGGDVRYAARLDLLGRFFLDPMANRSTAWYGSGGVSLVYDGFERWRPLLTLAIGVEGPARGPVSPAAEVGLGGGARVAIILRWRRGALR